MIRVGLVDDQQLVRAGFAMVVGSQDDMSVAWEVADGAEAIRRAGSDPVDVILMDVRMPGMDGIAATTDIIAIDPAARIIVLTTFDNDDYVLDSIAAGASGFLLKDADPEELLTAVRTVAAGESVLAPASTARLLKKVRPLLGESDGRNENEDKDKDKDTDEDTDEGTAGARGGRRGVEKRPLAPVSLPDPLTPREQEILMLMARGLSNPEIAAELFISMPTVKTHVGRVLAKTGSRDRVQAVIYAYSAGLVAGDDLLGG